MTAAHLDTPAEQRYGAIAIVLHWTIAVLILTQIGLGWYMNHVLPDHSPAQDRIETLHISIGLTTLLLIAVRIVVRLVRPPPPLPSEHPAWLRLLAGASHLLFYLLMLALPLSGWALVSVRGEPFHFWGLGWPSLPGLGFLTGPEHRPQRHSLQDLHTDYLVWIALANLALHVAGALKHQFDGHPVLWRMLPGRRSPAP
jgi:cytochrome b561